jgi:aminoglycoside phosphotransferase (APT) family kinase protein
MIPTPTTFTAEAACAALREAGLDFAPAQVRVEARDDRWLVRLPGERLTWFPANAKGRELLERERRVLRLLAERCSFGAPRVLFESEQGWDVRAAVPGVCDPWPLYRRTLTDVPLARRLGAAIGAILVEQHMRVSHADVAGWLPMRPAWPAPSARIRQSLPDVIDDRGLLAEIDRALDACDNVIVAPDDHVLVHGDLGLHNIAVDRETTEVRGVFDYDEASWADRHNDFRYLIFHHEHDHAVEAALAVYEPTLGRTLSRPRIRLYNARLRDRLSRLAPGHSARRALLRPYARRGPAMGPRRAGAAVKLPPRVMHRALPKCRDLGFSNPSHLCYVPFLF